MSEHPIEAARRGLERHPALSRDDGTYVVTSTPFEASIAVERDGRAVAVNVTVRVPTLDAIVVGESVAPVVQDGWFETFERRIEAVGGVTREEPKPPVIGLDRDRERVEVRFALRSTAGDQAIEDAKALVDFVEGTYVQGIIPGYEYGEPVAWLIDRARNRSAAAEG